MVAVATPLISLVIPAYNEAARIQNTVAEAIAYFEAQQLPYQIIVSADGTDDTRAIVANMAQTNPHLQVIGSAARGGKGLGIRRALPLVKGKYVGFNDADNKTPITEFDKVLPLLEQGIEVVIGSRALQDTLIEKQQKLHRRIGSWGFGVLVRTLLNMGSIRDTQCGFKFFQAAVFHDLFTHQQIDGYMYDIEILYLALLRNYRIEQVPVRWRDDGDSRLDVIAGNIRNIRDVLWIWRNVRALPPATQPLPQSE